MGKTSININEKALRAELPASAGGEIGVVVNAKRGRSDKVYTITTVDQFKRIYGEWDGVCYHYCTYLLRRGNTLKVINVQPESSSSYAAGVAVKEENTTQYAAKAVAKGVGYNDVVVDVKKVSDSPNLVAIKVIAEEQTREVFTTVSYDPESPYYYGRVVNGVSDIIEFAVVGNIDEAYTDVKIPLEGGTGAAMTDEKYIGGTDIAAIESAKYFSDREIDITTLLAPGTTAESAIKMYSDVINSRKDCVIITDADDASLTKVLKSSYVACYTPQVNIPSIVGPCNASLAVVDLIAKLSRASMQYKAPAGIAYGVLADVSDVAKDFSPDKIAEYQEANVNPVIVRSDVGCVVWGQSCTTKNPTEISRLAVRLLTNYFKRAVYRISQRFIFEDNNEITWGRWINAVEPVIRDVYSVGGIQRYTIACDATTMTPEEMANGIMKGKITFQPNSQIEVIDVTFTIDETGVSFE